MTPDPSPEERAVEALAGRLYTRWRLEPERDRDRFKRWDKENELFKDGWRDIARADLRAFGAAGLHITDLTDQLTAEEAHAVLEMLRQAGNLERDQWEAYERAYPKLRRLSSRDGA